MKRTPIAPEIPTVLEAGRPAMAVSSWYGLLAPVILEDTARWAKVVHDANIRAE